MVKLHNKFIVRKVAKTSTRFFKDLRVGDIVEISFDVKQRRSYGSSCTGPKATVLAINNQDFTATEIDKMVRLGFEFEEV